MEAVVEAQKNLVLLQHLELLENCLGGSFNQHKGVHWWNYKVGEGETLTVRYTLTPQGKFGLKTRDSGTFDAALERIQHHFGEATITQLVRTPLPLEEALTRLGRIVLERANPQLLNRLEQMAHNQGLDGFVFIRMSDLECLVQWGEPESIEGCLYLFCVLASQTQKAAKSRAA